MCYKVLWLTRWLVLCGCLLLTCGLAAQQQGTAIAEVTAVYSGSHHILIEWITLGEQDTDYFAVERSEDGERFEEIGRLTGQGRTVFRHSYNFFDYRSDPQQTAYYRVRQVDFGGASGCTRIYVVAPLRVSQLPQLATAGAVQREGTGAPHQPE